MRGQGPRACAGRACAQRGPVTVQAENERSEFRLVIYKTRSSAIAKGPHSSVEFLHLRNIPFEQNFNSQMTLSTPNVIAIGAFRRPYIIVPVTGLLLQHVSKILPFRSVRDCLI